jgi:predicted dehydrogenase
VVAVPTAYHVDTALKLIEAGVHLLVEKPLAATAAAGRELVDAAETAGLVLAVGHVERFNPAVADLPIWVDQPIHVETVRTSPYTARISDGVVFDLLIHDIDIVCSLAGPDAVVEHVDGVSQTVRSTSEDLVSVNLRFSTGLTARLTASRLGQEKIRRIEVTQDDSVVIADLLRQSITIQRMSRHEFLSEQGMSYRQSSVVEIPFLETRGEPLALELQHFVDCVRSGEQSRVDGHAGARAVELAERIVDVVQ